MELIKPEYHPSIQEIIKTHKQNWDKNVYLASCYSVCARSKILKINSVRFMIQTPTPHFCEALESFENTKFE